MFFSIAPCAVATVVFGSLLFMAPAGRKDRVFVYAWGPGQGLRGGRLSYFHFVGFVRTADSSARLVLGSHERKSQQPVFNETPLWKRLGVVTDAQASWILVVDGTTKDEIKAKSIITEVITCH